MFRWDLRGSATAFAGTRTWGGTQLGIMQSGFCSFTIHAFMIYALLHQIKALTVSVLLLASAREPLIIVWRAKQNAEAAEETQTCKLIEVVVLILLLSESLVLFIVTLSVSGFLFASMPLVFCQQICLNASWSAGNWCPSVASCADPGNFACALGHG